MRRRARTPDEGRTRRPRARAVGRLRLRRFAGRDPGGSWHEALQAEKSGVRRPLERAPRLLRSVQAERIVEQVVVEQDFRSGIDDDAAELARAAVRHAREIAFAVPACELDASVGPPELDV